MGPKHPVNDEQCMRQLILAYKTSQQTTNTSPASSSSPDSKRQIMGKGATRRRRSAAVAVLDIHVVPGPLVNSYGNPAEGMLGTSTETQQNQAFHPAHLY
jgi:hypothetical protein